MTTDEIFIAIFIYLLIGAVLICKYEKLEKIPLICMIGYPIILVLLLVKELLREIKYIKGERKWKKKRH